MFNPEYGLFKLRENYEPHYLEVSPEHLQPVGSEKLYLAVGRFLALTITQGNPIRVNFPVMFYARLLGTNISSLEDIAGDEPKLFDSLDYVRKAEQDGLDGIEMDSADGSVVQLTVENRDALIRHRINTLISPEALPFIEIIRKGFNDVIPIDSIRDLFSPIEFGLLIVGKSDFSVDEFAGHVRLTGYTRESDQIQWLIQLLRDFTAEQRAKFLRFVTSSTQLPSGGFAGLSTPFTVSIKAGSADSLPTSQTCFYTLQLPQHTNEETLRAKVSIAIEADSGMGLS
jgi:E3 ubiquitin-protein ligase HUWE1